MKPALGYSGATVLVAAFFVLLQHIGNQTPFGMVAEKLAAEFEAEPHAWGTRQQDVPYFRWEYCYLSGAVLAGSAPSTTPFRDALSPPVLVRGRGLIATAGGGWCHALRRALGDIAAGGNTELLAHTQPVRDHQWIGSKALYAIGLRFVTVHEYHEFIRKATYCAYAALGMALALLGWRVLVVASPLLVFGATLSGIEYLSDVAKGTPYAWGVFSAALVALLLRIAPPTQFIGHIGHRSVLLRGGHGFGISVVV